MEKKNLNSHPYRVLIVDDDVHNWANPMKEALQKKPVLKRLKY